MTDNNIWAWLEDEQDEIDLAKVEGKIGVDPIITDNKIDNPNDKEIADLLDEIDEDIYSDSKKEIFNSEDGLKDNLFEDELDSFFIKDEEENLVNTDKVWNKSNSDKNLIKNNDKSWNKFASINKKYEGKLLHKTTDSTRTIKGNHINTNLHSIVGEEKKKNNIINKESIEKAKEIWFKENTKDTPIDNETTRNIIISSNGMSLSEFLINRRNSKRKKKEAETKKDVVNRGLSSMGKEPWEQELYIKRKVEENNIKEKISKIRKENKFGERVPSNKFLEAHIKSSPYEKQIMKSLGITQEELSRLVSPNSILSDTEKAKLLSAGYFGTKKVSSGSKNKYNTFLTIGDLHVLYFLDKFKFSNNKSLAIAINKSYETVRGLMNKLNHLGMVKKISIIGGGNIWTLTETGSVAIDSTRRLVTRKQSTPYALSERMYVNHVAACLFSNRINALNLDDFPFNGRYFEGEYIRGETLIPESDLTSSLGKNLIKIAGGSFTKNKYKGERVKILSEQVEIEWRRWENNGRRNLSPEEKEGQEHFYILFSNNGFTRKYVIPDIVVKRERGANGEPNNIAIEVEKQIRSVDDYIKKLLVYKGDDRVYSKVVYITPHNKVAQNIVEAAKKIEFDRFDIMPPMNEDGPTKEVSGWII